MITSVRLVNFKNFADETLKIGPFTIIVGANASGKSNLRDAFRFLHGIGRGYNLAEIMGGKYGPGGQLEWEPIRGAPNEIVRFQKLYPYESSTFTVSLDLNIGETKAFYSIKLELNPNTGFVLLTEELKTEKCSIYATRKTSGGSFELFTEENGDQGVEVSSLQPALRMVAPALMSSEKFRESGKGPTARLSLEVLENMRFLEPSPQRMREPSVPGAAILGDGGENLPTVLEAICADSQREKILMSWLQELTPMDVKDFEFPRDPSGRVHLQIVECSGRKVSAYSASDGTLRFLALLAALLGPNERGLYFFEEIDNGIHPNRLWLLMDFIERQTAKGKVQVITTTHSPALLSWMNDTTFENTAVVYRDEYWTDSVIRPIAGLYNLKELRQSVTLGELHTEGWIEQAMKAAEGDSDTDYLDDDEDDWEQGTLE